MIVEQLVEGYLGEAEALFGPMVSCWRYGGVEFNDAPPHLIYFPETATVAISLSEKARNDDLQLCFQLSHEVCHMLYPSLNIETLEMEKPTVLNEGLSTFFSVCAVAQFGEANAVISNLAEHSKNYYEALVSVNNLLASDADSVKKLRNIEPYVNRLKVEHFYAAGVDVLEDLKSQLLRKFE